MKIPLSKIEEGERGFICEFLTNEETKQNLQNFGITKGCNIKCVYSAVNGDPRAYVIRDRLLALRNNDTNKIIISVDRNIP